MCLFLLFQQQFLFEMFGEFFVIEFLFLSFFALHYCVFVKNVFVSFCILDLAVECKIYELNK